MDMQWDLGMATGIRKTRPVNILFYDDLRDRHRASYFKLLNSIASDLDVMLNDLCRTFPYPANGHSSPHGSSQSLKSGDEFEHYLEGARLADEDDGSSDGVCSAGREDRCDSTAPSSSDVDFYSLEDMDQSSLSYLASSEGESPSPSSPVTPSPMPPPPAPPPHPPPPQILQPDLLPISTVEKLIRTHPVWYLPNIGRTGAFHLLKHREQGIFLVRQSSKNDTMCLSVRTGEKPRIDHYLIETVPKGLKLEGSSHHFSAIPVLIAHYCENFDELPIKLVLPPAVQEAQTYQELTSLALLGPDFWTSTVSRMKPVVKPASKPGVSPYDCGQPAVPSEPVTMSFSSNGAFTAVPSRNGRHSDPPLLQTFASSTTNLSSGQVEHSKENPNQGSITVSQVSQIGTSSSQRSSFSGTTGTHVSHLSTFISHSASQQTQQSSINTGGSTANRYYRSHLREKLSDYEDIWNPPSPQDTLGSTDPVFLPIVNGSSEQNLMGHHPESAPFSAINPGYLSDSSSDKGNTIPKSASSSLPRETEHMEETKTTETSRIKIDLKPKSQGKLFTFDVTHPREAQKPVPTTKPPPLPMWGTPITTRPEIICPQPVRQPQHSSPSYAEPYDSRIGKVNGVTDTIGTIKVSNSLRSIAEEQCNSAPVPPIAEQYSMPLIDFSEPRTQKEEFHAIMQQAESLEPILSPRLLSHDAKSGSQSSLIYDLPSVSPPRRYRWSIVGPQSTCNTDTAFTQGNMQRSQSMKVLPLRVDPKPFKPQNHAPANNRAQIPLPKQMETLSRVGKSTPTISSESHTPKIKVPIPPQIKLVSGASSDSDAHSRGPKMSQSFEENFFKPELMRRLENLQVSTLRKFPVHHSHHSINSNRTSFSETTTVEDIISDVSPELTVKPIKPLTVNNVSRMSEYDNMNGLSIPSSRRTMASSVGTFYCQPWDSSKWEELLTGGNGQPLYDVPTVMDGDSPIPGAFPVDDQWLEDIQCVEDDRASSEADYSSIYVDSIPELGHQTELANSFDWQNSADKDSATETTPQPPPFDPSPPQDFDLCDGDQTDVPHLADVSDDEGMEDDHKLGLGPENFRDRIMPYLATPRLISLRNRSSRTPGSKMRDFVFRLAQDKTTTFGVTVDNFIQCTKEGLETNPNIVMRNVRQFMNGIKNYLIQTGEAELNAIIEQERNKLNEEEFLNIDAILEGALHKCVIRPLKQHIYELFVEEYRKNGNLQQLSDNIKFARTKSLQQLGIKPEFVPPQGTSMEVIKHFLTRMQRAYSPLKKLENLLGATSSIYNSVQSTKGTEPSGNGVCLGADDFLPMFMYVLSHCGLVSAEIEADYMWGLLHPCLLAGEGGYYLTTLSSAVHVLKNMKAAEEIPDSPSAKVPVPSISDLQGFMKIIMPDEKHDSIITKTLPVRPNMTTKDVCSMIAHKFKITNPQDYGLYVLIAGVEDRLADNQSPQSVKTEIGTSGQDCVFAYKRNNARFVWPVSLRR